MPPSLHVHVVANAATDEIPGRFGEGALRELVVTMGGTVGDDEDVRTALSRTFDALPEAELAERLLEAVLTEPPIPAYCEALVRAMKDPATAPWRTHALPGDRVWLWYAHRLLAWAQPDRYPAPAARHLVLEVTPLQAAARVPGKRAPAHDRTAFAAQALAAGPSILVDDDATVGSVFDRVWAVDIGDRRPLPAADAERRGAPEGAVATTVEVWVPDGALLPLAVGVGWTVDV